MADLDKIGKSIEFRDALIAGIVLEHKVMINTRNQEHFKRVEGIVLYQQP